MQVWDEDDGSGWTSCNVRECREFVCVGRDQCVEKEWSVVLEITRQMKKLCVGMVIKIIFDVFSELFLVEVHMVLMSED